MAFTVIYNQALELKVIPRTSPHHGLPELHRIFLFYLYRLLIVIFVLLVRALSVINAITEERPPVWLVGDGLITRATFPKPTFDRASMLQASEPPK